MTYLFMAALAALVCVWLTRPLWLARLGQLAQRRAANVAAYQSRVSELESEVAAGLLTAEQAEQLKAEHASRLLLDAEAPETAVKASPRRYALTAAVTVLTLAASAAWYWQAGSWRTAALVAAAPAAAPAQGDASKTPEVQAMVAQLEKRMQAEPDKAEGWALLGRSYSVMERYKDAAEAYAKANGLSAASPNPEWLTGEGEALGLSRDRDLQGRPAQLFDAALRIAPDYNKALWYGGLAAMQGNDPATAKARLGTLAKQDLPAEIRDAVKGRLDELAQVSGQAAAMTASAPRAAASTAETPAADGAAIKLAVTVQIKPELQGKMRSDAILFVFAKAASGPPMPLAVQRIPGATLPMSLTLDDSMGMIPSLKLSQFEKWVITARLSTAGSVQVQPGDLQGSLTVAKADAGKPLTVIIDQVAGQ